MTQQDRWLVYGAYGYTGRLIAEQARRRDMEPVLAGRRPEPLRETANHLQLECKAFELGSADEIARQIEGYAAVMLAAGPFSETSAPVVEACLRTGAHYLDITGEIAVFEAIFARDAEARERGVALLPGVGFDVVPTDCLAKSLVEALPTATRLDLAFCGLGSSSRGTMKTAIEGLPQGGAIRRDGEIVSVPPGYDVLQVPFRDQIRSAVTIPWGDVSTAYHSTGVPNIRVYMAQPPAIIRAIKMMKPIQGMIGSQPVQRTLKAWIDRTVDGPDEQTRQTARSHLWGRATDDAGRSVQATMETPEGYHLTALTSVEAVHRLLTGPAKKGALTPSLAFGADFIQHFQDCDLEVERVHGEEAP